MGGRYTIPPPPREQLCNRYCSNKHTHLLLGRDTKKRRRADPVFHELLHLPNFACLQPLLQVNLKLAHWLQEWETIFWQWQCGETASKFGFCRVPTLHDLDLGRSRSSTLKTFGWSPRALPGGRIDSVSTSRITRAPTGTGTGRPPYGGDDVFYLFLQ
jgi:hypothetical protein